MKLLWFHLMPYPDLPEDFNRKHRSVWVDIDPGLFDPEVMADCYERYIEQLVYAEECGFDGICINEHHGNGYGLMPSPNVLGSVLATRTSRAAITVLGNSVALYNPVVRVAEEMAMLDLLSRGRLISGFPVGTSMDTAYAYSVNPGNLRDKYYEGIDLILKAWTATEPFAFNGRFTQLRNVNVLPRPLQRPHPPIWIPGGGSVETWDYCADRDFVYAALSYYGHLMAKETVGGFWRQVEAHGKDPNPYRLAFLQFIGVADTDQEAYRLYKEPAEYFFNRSLHVYPGYTDPPGYVTEASVRARYKSQVRAVARVEAGQARPHVGRDGGEGLRGDRQPRHGPGDARGRRPHLQLRPPAHDAAVRQHERRAHQVQHQALRRQGGSGPANALRRRRGPLVADQRGGGVRR